MPVYIQTIIDLNGDGSKQMQNQGSQDPKSTEGMVDYNRNSTGQQRQVDSQADHIRGLVEKIGRMEPEFRIVDYGCGPGASTVNVMRPAIEACRSDHPEIPIVACHCDQPGNDWNALFELATGPQGYMTDHDGIRIEAAIGSFYDQMAAEDTVALGTCFAASHWLEHPVHLDAPGSLWFADLVGDARRQMASSAAADWARFLRSRAVEIRHGGYLHVATLGAVPDSDEPSGFAVSGRGPYRALQAVTQSMVDDGLISQTALDHFVFPFWFMTEEEARRPLLDDALLAGAFDIEEISVVPAPVNPDDLFAASINDPAEYARLYTGTIRAFGDSTLRTQLLEPASGGGEAAVKLADELYRRLEALYRTHPGRYAFEMWHLTIVLRRM